MKRSMKSAAAVFSMAGTLFSAWATTTRADTYSWVPTATGITYNWNNSAGQDNWSTTAAFPNAAVDVANLTNNIAGAQTLSLQQDITVGTLNLGDQDGLSSFTIAPGALPASLLILQATSGAAQLNLGTAGTIANFVTSNVQLNSAAVITAAGGQKLSLAGETNFNGMTLTLAGVGAGTIDFGTNTSTGKITGTGALIKNNATITTIFNPTNTYTGSVQANNGKLLIVTGKLSTASAINVSGFWSAPTSTTSLLTGGLLEVGDLSNQATNPGQRLPTQGLSFDGGHLNYIGQKLATNTGETIQDNIANLTFNSGYSIISVGVGANTAASVINVATLNRNNRATAAIRSTTLAGTARVLAGNVNTDGAFLLGAPGGTGTSTRIIPWMVANNTNVSSVNPSVFATYSAGGLRALIAGEFDSTLIGTATRNVVANSANLGTNVLQTVNSININTGSNSNIGSGSVLTVTSGGVLFNGSFGASGTIGIPGDAAAGTLAFGSAEGVVWSLSQNTNAIGAVITGTGGLTKAGLGTLTLTGNNLYSGKTVVSAGTLRIGNGVQASNVGTGDVDVAVGATLRISAADAIANAATLTLDQHGIVNGKLILDVTLVEQVGGLVLGGVMQTDGYYGSLSAVAANPLFTVTSSDVYFSGAGLLHVVAVPEPASIGLLFSAALLLTKRRRASRTVEAV